MKFAICINLLFQYRLFLFQLYRIMYDRELYCREGRLDGITVLYQHISKKDTIGDIQTSTTLSGSKLYRDDPPDLARINHNCRTPTKAGIGPRLLMIHTS
jgi:hypothetical protein